VRRKDIYLYYPRGHMSQLVALLEAYVGNRSFVHDRMSSLFTLAEDICMEEIERSSDHREVGK